MKHQLLSLLFLLPTLSLSFMAEDAPLFQYAKNGDLQNLERELDAGIDVNSKTVLGESALIFAIEECRTEAAQLLIERGAELEFFTKLGYSPLILAAAEGCVDIVKELLDHQVNVNAEEPRKRFNALFKAIEFDRREVVSLLLQQDAQVNYRNTFGVTPLMLAAQMGRKEIIDLLLQKKADVNAASIIGYTPLLYALEFGHPAIAEVLLGAGAQAGHVDKYNRSVLTVAAAKGYSQIVELLVQKGVDVNVKSEKGETAISLANKNAFTDVVKFLLEHGADSTGVKIAADSTAQDSTLAQKDKEAVAEETVAVTPPEPIGGLEGIQKRLRYPKKAKEAGLQGTIKLEVTVTRMAQVKSIKIIDSFGDRECEKAAETACRNTRWKQARKGKKTVEGTAVVTLEFKLEP